MSLLPDARAVRTLALNLNPPTGSPPTNPQITLITMDITSYDSLAGAMVNGIYTVDPSFPGRYLAMGQLAAQPTAGPCYYMWPLIYKNGVKVSSGTDYGGNVNATRGVVMDTINCIAGDTLQLAVLAYWDLNHNPGSTMPLLDLDGTNNFFAVKCLTGT